MAVSKHDPPLGLQCDLGHADVVSLHVPLTRDGRWPTAAMLNEGFIDTLKRGAFLINTSRGGVVDESALLSALESGRLGGCALDVFRRDPFPDPELLTACTLATPHVAGRSLEGLMANTAAIAAALADAFNAEAPQPPALDAPSPVAGLEEAEPCAMVRKLWQLERLSTELRRRPDDFKVLRDQRPLRRDLSAWPYDSSSEGAGAAFLRAIARGSTAAN